MIFPQELIILNKKKFNKKMHKNKKNRFPQFFGHDPICSIVSQFCEIF